MKKIVVFATCIAAVAANALPTYEPFTEYNALVAANPTNSIDLCTSGLIAPSGEPWLNQSFSGTVGTDIKGLDIQVTNWSTSVFTYGNLQSVLPANFPGFPGAGGAITTLVVNPAQPLVNGAASANIVGNSAVLQFAQDITRPAAGTKTLFVSYLFALAQQGTAGSGNIGRYLGFLPATNIVEGKGTTGFYQTWQSMYNAFGANNGPRYFGQGVLVSGSLNLEPQDSAVGKTVLPNYTVFPISYNTPYLVVGEFVFVSAAASAAGTKDTNIVWVNPSTSAFGGQTPTSLTENVDTMVITMPDVNGMVLLDRPGAGQSGGVGTNYIANLMLGSTWSYVTGGPEFTNQPASVFTNYGSSATLSGEAVAAGQSVSYQWLRVTGTTTNNVSDGSGGAGGGATVSGATTGTLTLTGLTVADYGSYQLLATANGTGLSLPSATVSVTADPLISVQPQNASAALGGTATFNISASTQFGPLTYQWQINGAPLANGTRADGSVIGGATTATLTVANFQVDENGATFTCAVSNSLPEGEISAPATLILADPAITSQPQPVTVNQGGTATFSAAAESSHTPMTYAWYDGSTMLVNGLQADGSTVSGAQGSSSGGTLNAVLTLNNVSYLDDGSYTLVVTNSQNNSVTSSAAALLVNDPYISTQPPAQVELAPGGTANISVVGGGAGAAYQWYSTVTGPLSNGGDDSGVTTPTLTISGAQASDAGTYFVIISGNNGSLQSSNVVVYVDSAVTSVSLSPSALTQQAGTHLALAGTVNGGTQGLLDFVWQLNGTTLNNGPQADGSIISGAGTSTLILSNVQVADSGTYTLIATNAANGLTATNVLSITAGLLPLSTNNLEVTRVGEGSEALSGATGNTLYLDQFTTNGSYVSTIMVPDSGLQTLIVPGAGNDGQNEAYLTRSSNLEYLNFAGYYFSYPYIGGSDVTIGQQTTGGSAADIRGIGAINGLGYYTLAYTNFGLYSAGNHYIRSAYSTDGLTNFWTTGAAGGTAIKYVNAGPEGAAYAEGSGVPGFSTAVTGARCLGLVGTNLVYSDEGDSVTPNILGLNAFSGAPADILGQPLPAGTTVNLLAFGSPADFRFSPDSNTVYVADDGPSISGGTSYGGGVQRWDVVNGVYTYAYTLEDTTGAGTGLTNGIRGLTVYFPPSITAWGPGVTGASVYATTAETISNRIIGFVDTGVSSSPTLLATAGPNQFFRGIRFGPATVPVSITSASSPVNSYLGQTATLTVGVSGDAPFTFQWQFDGTNIAGATNSSLALSNLVAGNSGTYTVVVSDPISTNSSSTVVSVSSGPPLLLAAPQSRVETAGDHLAFTVSVAGTPPINYQWESNGVVIAGATTAAYSLTNIVAADSATYSVTYSNVFGVGSSSATLGVTSTLQALSSNNLVVARVGDGVEPLSSVTGNTVYLDQFTPAGVYSNTIMIPDNEVSGDLVVSGGAIEAPQGSVLNLSYNNSNFLNFVGYATPYPATNQLLGEKLPRAIGAVNAFGYYDQALSPITLYDSATADVFDSAVSLDGFSAFWTTGAAGSGASVKYVTAATSGTSGGIVSIAGTSGGTRVVNIIAGNIAFSDDQASPPGIWAVSGEPTVPSSAADLVADAAGNPNDFAASPDTSGYPPATSTVYVGDSSTLANGGGIQRYDWNGSAYVLSYTLGAGTGLSNGVGSLTVDFSAQTTWGPGVLGAVIYATTTGTPGNNLIKVIDTGAGSSATVLATANTNEVLRGIRFGPVEGIAIISANPQSTNAFVGGTAVFTTVAQNGPFTYQWQLNGINLTNGLSPSGSGAVISGAQTAVLTVSNVGAVDDQGSYTVTVSNPDTNGVAASVAAILTVPVNITSFPPTVEYVTNGGIAQLTVGATGGAPLTYQWSGPCGGLSDGADPCGGTGIIAGSSTATLTISNVSASDAGAYTVNVSNPESSLNSGATPSVLTVLTTSPQFASGGAISGLSTGSPMLNLSGEAGTTYRVWATTNLDLRPITSEWTLIGSGTFSGGADTFAIPATNADEFYIVTQP